jgi:hypothetical protein
VSVLTARHRPSHHLPLRARLRHLGETIRWAPAPHFEGPARDRWRYVGYLAGSVLLWTALTLVVVAGLARALLPVG